MVVTGCWAQTNPGGVAALAGVDLVVGNADKHRLPDLLTTLLAAARGAPGRGRRRRAARLDPVRRLRRVDGRSRAFVKIQDGCQHRCAFCIVPLARGASRSLDPEIIVEQVRRLVEAGHPEIVLTGVDLGHYGRRPHAAHEPGRAARAARRGVRACAGCGCPRCCRRYFTEELLDIAHDARRSIAPHFHVPLQSGSDRVLRRMRRPYTIAMYRRVVERLAGAHPAARAGRRRRSSGFPGETDADFAETLALRATTLPFSYLHVFPYSARHGHRGGRAAGPGGGARDRHAGAPAARASARAKSRAFRAALVGQVEDVLVLETRDRATGDLTGLTGQLRRGRPSPGPTALMRRLAPRPRDARRVEDGRATGEAGGRGMSAERRPSASSAAAGSTSSRA